MKAQEIFDTVAKHLAKQGRRALREAGGCAYRGNDGMKCAIGCLITDDEYRVEMEGLPVGNLRDRLPGRLRRNKELLIGLQDVHDEMTADIRAALEGIASRKKLSTAVLKDLTFPEIWT